VQRRRGLYLFILSWLPWLCLAILSYLGMTLWGAVAGLAVLLLLLILMPSGGKWGILQAFSLLFFLVAVAAALILGERIDNRIPNLLAGGFACLTIMAGYGALENIFFPSTYFNIDHPDSMRESPVLRQTYWALTLMWDAVFLSGLAVNLVSMLALQGDTSIGVAAISSIALFLAGIILTLLIALILPRRLEADLVERGPLAIKWEPPVLEPGRPLRKNEYDAAVVGSGIGGLACTALLSKAGMKVLLVEKARKVGGYCQTFNWEGYPLNSGPTLLLGGGVGGAMTALVRRLGLEKDAPMRRLEWGLANGKLALRLGAGMEKDLEKVGGKFPKSKEGLKRLMSDLRRFKGELEDRPDPLSSPLPSNLDEYHEQFIRHPLSARWQNISFQAMLEEYINDDSLVRLMGGISCLLGGNPRTYPAYEGARLLVSLFLEGPAYPEHHLSHLAQKLSGFVTSTGGEVLTSNGAEEVLFQGEGTKAAPIGLRLSDGSQIRSKVVILNVDPRRAVTGLLQPSILGFSFIKEMEKLKISPSAFVLHFIFSEDLRIPERVFLFPPKTRRVRTGDTYMEVDSILLSKERSTLDGGKGCVLMARINVPNKNYHAFEDATRSSELGAELTALIKTEIASILPAVKRSKKEFVTLPSHYARLTSNGQGAAFGFAPMLTQWYFRRPGPRLIPPNLYLVGAWSRYGGGLEGAVLSGIITARELCGGQPYAGRAMPVSAKPAASAGPEEAGEKEEAEGKGRIRRSFLSRKKKRKGGKEAE